MRTICLQCREIVRCIRWRKRLHLLLCNNRCIGNARFVSFLFLCVYFYVSVFIYRHCVLVDQAPHEEDDQQVNLCMWNIRCHQNRWIDRCIEYAIWFFFFGKRQCQCASKFFEMTSLVGTSHRWHLVVDKYLYLLLLLLRWSTRWIHIRSLDMLLFMCLHI